MSQCSSLSFCCFALCRGLVRTAKAEKADPQTCPGYRLEVRPGLMNKRAMGDRIIELEHIFEVRPGRSKPTRIHQVSTRGEVVQKEPADSAALKTYAFHSEHLRVQEEPGSLRCSRLEVDYPIQQETSA